MSASAYITDLVDHKTRVGKYLRVGVTSMLRDHTFMDTIDIYPSGRPTLLDLVVWVGNHGAVPTQAGKPRLGGMLGQVAQNTLDYFGYKREYWLTYVVSDLFERAVIHDHSKFGPEEFDAYNEAFPELAAAAYGTPEFKAALSKIQPALLHHYQANDHHPEHHQDGMAGMHAVQLIDTSSDWLAASERSQRDIMQGLEINRKRFGIDDYLFPVLKETVIYLREAGRGV